MNQSSMPRRINIVALLVAAAGIFIIFLSAPDLFPAVPPGVLILIAVAATVAFAPGRWTPLIGLLAPLLIGIGAIANETSLDIINGEENTGAIVGTAILIPALVTAIAAGAIAVIAGGQHES